MRTASLCGIKMALLRLFWSCCVNHRRDERFRVKEKSKKFAYLYPAWTLLGPLPGK